MERQSIKTENSVTYKNLPLEGARFVFVEGLMVGREGPITKETFFIGRSNNNNLVIEDRSVSRKHAVLNYLEGRYVLTDLNSFGGTFVNGQKIQDMVLKDKDRVRIGKIVLEFKLTKGGTVLERAAKRRWPYYLPLLLLLAGGATVGFLKYKRPVANVAGEVEYNYSLGIKAYNIDKDPETARKFWKKVLELDPAARLQTTRNAKILLNNLPMPGMDNFGEAKNR